MVELLWTEIKKSVVFQVHQVAAALSDGAIQVWDLEHPHVRAYK